MTVIVTSIWLLLLYILHARRTPNPLISLDLFKTRTFSIGIVGNIATRLGTGCVPFLMPLMLQVGFGYQAFIAGCMMAPTALGSIIAKSMVTQVLRRLGYRHTLSGDHGDYWANDRSVLFAITSNGDMDADLAVVYIRDGYVDAIYRDEYHHTCRSDR